MAEYSNYKVITKPGSSDVEVKKSHFLTSLKCCRTEDEAKAFIEEVRKANRDARHNCFAMRIGTPDSIFERFSDDGEPQGTAGRPMLEILKGNGLCDVCAVVTRYFGGTLLGTGGLVRAYSDSLKEAVAASDISALSAGYSVAIRCDYSTANRIQRFAAGLGIFSMEENYGADCELIYLIPEEDATQFAAKVTEMSAGSAEVSMRERVLYYGKEHPAIYAQLPVAD